MYYWFSIIFVSHLPDVSFLVNKLSQYMQAPTEIHIEVAKRLLCYLKGALDHSLYLSRTTYLSHTTFCDSDWAGDTHDHKSIASYLIYMRPNVISWFSKKQPIIVKSSTEVEYRTIATTTTKPLWLRKLLKEFGHPSRRHNYFLIILELHTFMLILYSILA